MDVTISKLIEAFEEVGLDNRVCYKILAKLYGRNLPHLMDNMIAHAVAPYFLSNNQEEKDYAKRQTVKAVSIRFAGKTISTGKANESIV